MKKRIAKIAAAVALMLTATASVGCVFLLIDEPKALKNMD